MKEEDAGESKPAEIDPTKLAQSLELELMAKRALWQQANAHRRSLRAVSFIFLFLVIIGAVFAVFYVASLMSSRHVGSGGTPPPPDAVENGGQR